MSSRASAIAAIPVLIVLSAAFTAHQANATPALIAHRFTVPAARIFAAIVATHSAATGTFPILRFRWRIGDEANQSKDGGRENPQAHYLIPLLVPVAGIEPAAY
jgi:hypothetical protein